MTIPPALLAQLEAAFAGEYQRGYSAAINSVFDAAVAKAGAPMAWDTPIGPAPAGDDAEGWTELPAEDPANPTTGTVDADSTPLRTKTIGEHEIREMKSGRFEVRRAKTGKTVTFFSSAPDACGWARAYRPNPEASFTYRAPETPLDASSS